MSEADELTRALFDFLSDDERDARAENRERGRVIDVRFTSEDHQKTSCGNDYQDQSSEKWYVVELVPISNRYAWILVRR